MSVSRVIVAGRIVMVSAPSPGALDAPDGTDAEQEPDGGLQEPPLPRDGGGAPRIVVRHRLEEGRVGEVAEDQVVESGGEMRELARVPRSERALEHAEALRVERPEEPAHGVPE